jgi:hypothetical protein
MTIGTRRWFSVIALVAIASCAWWLFLTDDIALPTARPTTAAPQDPQRIPAAEPAELAKQRTAVPTAANEQLAGGDPLAAGPPMVPSGNMARFTGRCLAAENGTPLADCTVKTDESGSVVARTGPDGTFDFHTELDKSGRRGLRIDAIGRAPREGDFEGLRDGDTEDLGDIPMQRGFVVTGRVVDPDGKGVTGNNVIVFGIDSRLRAGQFGQSTASAACAEDGSFTLDMPMPPGDWKAQLFGKDRQRGDGAFHIDATTGCAPLLLVTERKVTISGIVVDDRGQELPDVVLRTENGDAITSSGPRHGKFRLVSTQQVSGPTRILLENPGDWADSFVPPTATWGQDDVRIVIPRVPDMAIEVVDQQGTPVEQFGVLFLPTERVSISSSRDYGAHPDGRLSLTTHRLGRHVLRVLPTQLDMLASEPQFVTVTKSALPVQRVTLERMRHASVLVVDADGSAIAGAQMSLVRIGTSLEYSRSGQQDPRRHLLWNGDRRSPELVADSTTGPNGETELFAPSSAQGFLLRVRATDRPPAFVEAPDFPVGAPLRIVLTKGGALAGRVELHGQSRDLFSIDLRDADGTAVALPRQQDSLQADGTFEIPLLPPGNYTVQVRRKVEVRTAGSMRIAWTTLANSIVHATVTAGETTHLSLDAPAQALGTLRGRIVPTSAGLTAAGLALLGTDNAVRGVFPIASDGSFFADDLLPGRYQVVVAKDANMLMNGIPATLAREIEVLPGGALREEFVLTPRKLTLRFRSAAGGPIDAPIELRYGSLLRSLGKPTKDLVLDPAPELPIQVRYEGSANWSTPITMPPDRSEHTAEVVIPAR